MTDIVQRLRDEWPYKIVEKHCVNDYDEIESQRADAADEIEILRRYIREIYEVYAGSEAIPLPVTASEVYLYQLLKQMVKIASEALSYKKVDKSILDEIEQLRNIVRFIANDQLELSHDKIKLQRDHWRKLCGKTE